MNKRKLRLKYKALYLEEELKAALVEDRLRVVETKNKQLSIALAEFGDVVYGKMLKAVPPYELPHHEWVALGMSLHYNLKNPHEDLESIPVRLQWRGQDIEVL